MSAGPATAAREIRSTAIETRRRSPWTMVILALSVVVLAVGPLVLTLLRAESYPSSTTISLASSNPDPVFKQPKLVVGLNTALTGRAVQTAVAREVGWLNRARDLPKHVTVRELGTDGQPKFVVTARGPSAQDAHDLAKAAAASLVFAGEQQGRFLQAFQLQKIKQALTSPAVSPARRRDLERHRDVFARAIRKGEPIFAAAPTEPTLAKERVVDRIIGELPGTAPSRPNPVWAALAGVVLALALGVWALLLGAAKPWRDGGYKHGTTGS